MTIRIAINGYGRIGRNIVRALYENYPNHDLQVVAINDLGNPAILAHLTAYDSVHGRFQHAVDHDEEALYIKGDRILTFAEKNPALLPWQELNIDVVFECTGLFTTRDQAAAHLQAGARKVLISAPGKHVDATVVFGVNHGTLSAEHHIISNASCTTNCLAPIAMALHQTVGIESGLMTTVHAYTNDQRLTDVYHTDLRRARAAALSMIPTQTGAAAAVGLVIPELMGKFDGLAVRVPTANVSLVDLTFVASRDTSVDDINDLITQASLTPALQSVLHINKAPLVSIDFNHSSYSSCFDATQTRVNGRLVKVMAWYDNEWGFCNRMLDTCLAWLQAA